MDQSAFEQTASETLRRLMEDIEDQLADHLEVDLQSGILEIELADGRKYVVNKHGPSREIWLSSPVSGAWHFAHEPQAGWISTRLVDGERKSLHAILTAELAKATAQPVRLTNRG